MKRRAAVEPAIEHLKRGHRLDRNRLKGEQADELNAILRTAGMNFRKLLRWLPALLRLFYCWLLSFQRTVAGLIPAAE